MDTQASTRVGEQRLEPITDVMRRVRMQKSKLYLEVAARRFPQPIKVGRGTAFVASEIDAWIASKIAERDSQIAQRTKREAGRTRRSSCAR